MIPAFDVNHSDRTHVETPLAVVNEAHSFRCLTRRRAMRATIDALARAFSIGLFDVDEQGELEINGIFILGVALLFGVLRLVIVAPAAYRSASQYNRHASPKFQFIDDARAVRRGPSLEEIPSVCADMRASFRSGHTLPMRKRKEQLGQLLKMLKEREDEILDALREDLSREHVEAFYYDFALPRAEIRAMLRNIRSWTGRSLVKAFNVITWPSKQWMERQPLGCALVCSSWNFPFLLSLVPVAGAIAAGNAVVLKPSNDSKASTALLVKLVREYCDPRVVQCVGSEVPGNGVDVMQTVLKEKFDVIFFTGSSKVGKIVARAAAENLTPCILELGGKNPVVVTDCADVDLAAKQCVWGRVINCGQQCISPEYVLCHESRCDEFERMCSKWAAKFVPDVTLNGAMARIGGPDPESRMKAIAKLIDDAKAGVAGDTVVYGGTYDVKRRLVEPTVIKCGEKSPFMEAELFAPILCVHSYKTLGQAVDTIQAQMKPLTMYVFSRSAKKTRFLLDNTHAGGVTVNGTLTHCAHDRLPFGGVGDSGYGRYHGRYSVECFQREKPVLQKTRWGRCLGLGLLSDPSFLYSPQAEWKTKCVRAVASLM